MADSKKNNKKQIAKKTKTSGKTRVKKTLTAKSKSSGRPIVKNLAKNNSKSNKKKTGKGGKTKAKSKIRTGAQKTKNKSANKALARSGSLVKAKPPAGMKPKAAINAKKKIALKKEKPQSKTVTKSTKPEKITFSIDGVTCKAKSGQSIVEAARDNGIYIPVLCYYEGMKPAGICRMCTVKVGGRFMAACTTPVVEGMIVENNIPEIENMRKAIVEMLFVEGNHMCPTCEKSGNCELQALGYRYKIFVPRFPYQFPDRQIDATYTKIMIDNNRCVHCRRCIRDITTKDGKHIFAMTKRSGKSRIIADQELEKNMSDDLAAKAMYQCPVGAILKKEVGFSIPIGKRKYDKAPIGIEIQK